MFEIDIEAFAQLVAFGCSSMLVGFLIAFLLDMVGAAVFRTLYLCKKSI